jgi:hypothetical protein
MAYQNDEQLFQHSASKKIRIMMEELMMMLRKKSSIDNKSPLD